MADSGMGITASWWPGSYDANPNGPDIKLVSLGNYHADSSRGIVCSFRAVLFTGGLIQIPHPNPSSAFSLRSGRWPGEGNLWRFCYTV